MNCLCYTIIIIVYAVSLIYSLILKSNIKRSLDVSTNNWTGKNAAVKYINLKNMSNVIRIKETDLITDRYDIAQSVLYVSKISSNSYSLYNYLNALRQSVVACYCTGNKKKYAARVAVSMINRFSGVITLILIVLSLVYKNSILLYIATINMSCFLVYQIFNGLFEKRFSKEIFEFSNENNVFDSIAEDTAKKYCRAVNFIEVTTAWNGTINIVLLIPRIIIDLISHKSKNIIKFSKLNH